MEDINSPVFAQAKIEYTKQLIDVLKLPLSMKDYKKYTVIANVYLQMVMKMSYQIFLEKV